MTIHTLVYAFRFFVQASTTRSRAATWYIVYIYLFLFKFTFFLYVRVLSGINNPLKGWVTTWQITQFYSCFAHALCVLFIFPNLEGWFPRQLAWLQFCYHLTMIYLFTFQLRWVPSILKTAEELKKEKGAKDAKKKSKKAI